LKKILKPITKSTIGEFEVISTPYKFHSYGMNMYLYKDVLFCGDMVQSVGKLVPIISKFNLDNEIYVDYLRKFDIKGINTICPSHGPSVSINE
jgi:glyoxylase-like metal-dependent hydrolase (beta-lactamase superfamily II)